MSILSVNISVDRPILSIVSADYRPICVNISNVRGSPQNLKWRSLGFLCLIKAIASRAGLVILTNPFYVPLSSKGQLTATTNAATVDHRCVDADAEAAVRLIVELSRMCSGQQ